MRGIRCRSLQRNSSSLHRQLSRECLGVEWPAMTRTDTGARSNRWPWIAALWCAGGLFEASQAVLIMRFAEGKRHAWLPLFATELATWLPWALVTPWIVGLARRHPIIRGTTGRTVAIHVAAFAVISA